MKREAKGEFLKIVTANALASGTVVFRSGAGTWVQNVDEAEVAGDAAAADLLLAAAQQDVANDIVVEPYLVNIKREGEHIRPVLLREAIRAAGGPTIKENRSLHGAERAGAGSAGAAAEAQ